MLSGYFHTCDNSLQTSARVWEKMIYLQSLGSLGLDSTIPFIRDCITGKSSEQLPLSFKIAAVHALANNFPEVPQRENVSQ